MTVIEFIEKCLDYQDGVFSSAILMLDNGTIISDFDCGYDNDNQLCLWLHVNDEA